MKKNKGVTLMALVITIIVLLVLAGLTMATLVGENGLFKTSGTALKEFNKAKYKEVIDIAVGTGVKTERVLEGLTADEYLDRYRDRLKEETEKGGLLENATVIDKREANPEDKRLWVVTEEGYVYEITPHGSELIGRKNENPPPDLLTSDINGIYTPSGPTQGPVTVELEVLRPMEGYTLQYSTDLEEWHWYTGEFTKEENGPIYARLLNNVEDEGGYATLNVLNIDKLPPQQFVPQVEATSRSITVTGSTTDAPATDKYASHKIIAYYFSIDDGQTWTPDKWVESTETTHKFEDLPQQNKYKVRMKAVDEAYNEIVTDSVDISTDKVTDLDESNVKFEYDPTTPTQGTVDVTIIADTSTYSLQYSLTGEEGSWLDYPAEGAVTVSDCGPIYARLWDGLNVGVAATGNVKNIDRLDPLPFEPKLESTSNSVTITGSTTDAPATDKDASHKIIAYYFSKDGGHTWTPDRSEKSTEARHTFEGLIQGTKFDLAMMAVDEAGNERVSSIESISTGNVTQLDIGNITFDYSPKTPTQGPVAVTIKTTVSEYTLQYSLTGEEGSWQDYPVGETIDVTECGPVFARLWDGTNASGGYAAGNVKNIDRLDPLQFTPELKAKTNSITVTGSTTDAPATDKYASYKIIAYYFSKDGGHTWTPNKQSTETTCTFNGLLQDHEYDIKMKAVDEAGNETITEAETKIKTEKVPDAVSTENNVNGNITFGYDPTTPTQGPVQVQITTKETEYTIQYSFTAEEGSWEDYPTGGTVPATTCGPIYARLWDGINAGTVATGNVKNIDRNPPLDFTPSIQSSSVTAYAMRLTGSTADADATSTDMSSGVSKYYYSSNNGSTWLPSGGTKNTYYDFSGLTPNTTYNLKMKAVDEAGNVKESSVTQQKTLGQFTLTATAQTGGTVKIGSGSYGSNGGSVTADVIVDTYTSVTASPNTGYNFDGWYNGNSYLSGSTTYNFYMPANAYTLTAHFSLKSYTITYYSRTGSSTTRTKTHGTNHTIISCPWSAPSSGYVFQGWSTSNGGTSVSYYSGNSYTGNSNLSLYAIWKCSNQSTCYLNSYCSTGYSCSGGTTCTKSTSCSGTGYSCIPPYRSYCTVTPSPLRTRLPVQMFSSLWNRRNCQV